MTHKNHMPCAIVILGILAGLPVLASADEKADRNLAVLKTLYTKLANSVTVSGNTLGPGHSFKLPALTGPAT